MPTPEALLTESRALTVEAVEGGPPMILTCDRRLRPEAIARIRRAWEETWRGDYAGPAPRIMILDAGLRLSQLVDGRWREVAGAECSPLPSPGLGRADEPAPEV